MVNRIYWFPFLQKAKSCRDTHQRTGTHSLVLQKKKCRDLWGQIGEMAAKIFLWVMKMRVRKGFLGGTTSKRKPDPRVSWSKEELGVGMRWGKSVKELGQGTCRQAVEMIQKWTRMVTTRVEIFHELSSPYNQLSSFFLPGFLSPSLSYLHYGLSAYAWPSPLGSAVAQDLTSPPQFWLDSFFMPFALLYQITVLNGSKAPKHASSGPVQGGAGAGWGAGVRVLKHTKSGSECVYHWPWSSQCEAWRLGPAFLWELLRCFKAGLMTPPRAHFLQIKNLFLLIPNYHFSMMANSSLDEI